MARAEGYRAGRLRRRRDRKVQRWQVVFLVALAVAVAFAAVAGAAHLAGWILGEDEPDRRDAYLALITFGEGEGGRLPSAVLALRDASDGSVSLYTVPRSLLLERPGGEYVLAGDMLASGELGSDLERLLDADIDLRYRLSYADLEALVARDQVWAELEEPVQLWVDGVERGYKGRAAVPSAQIGTLLGAEGENGADEAAMQEALMRAVLGSVALQPEADRKRLIGDVVAAARGKERRYLREILTTATDRDAELQRLPSFGKTALGQFVYRPDGARIMAEITRRAPGFSAPVTVLVRNGSGELGIGDLVAERLAVLDVALPEPANADSFDYRKTQILAGSDALRAAQDVRAILGRGVVLDGNELGPATIVVIVGRDLTAKDLQ
jgi:hypothetical protein